MERLITTKTAVFVGSLALGCGLFGCERLLSVDHLTERQTDDDASAMVGPVPDATPSESDEQQATPQSNTGLEATGPNGVDGTSDDAESDDAGLPGDDSTVPDASLPSNAQFPGDADATVPLAMDSSIDADVADAPPDSAPPPPPKGCAAGVPVRVMKVGTAVNFMTTGAVCVTLMGTSISGWNASNVGGRGVTVVGSMTQTLTTIPEGKNEPALGPGPDGYIYWNFKAGLFAYASVTGFR